MAYFLTFISVVLGFVVTFTLLRSYEDFDNHVVFKKAVKEIEIFGKPVSPIAKLLVEDTMNKVIIIKYIDKEMEKNNQ